MGITKINSANKFQSDALLSEVTSGSRGILHLTSVGASIDFWT